MDLKMEMFRLYNLILQVITLGKDAESLKVEIECEDGQMKEVLLAEGINETLESMLLRVKEPIRNIFSFLLGYRLTRKDFRNSANAKRIK